MSKKKKIKSLKLFPKFIKTQIKLNHAELKISILEEIIKNELYNTLMDRVQAPNEIERLRKENKTLRAKNRELKDKLKGESDAR